MVDRYRVNPAYPTAHHQAAAEALTGFFAGRPGVDAVLLTCSCARGKASPDSCLDIAVLVSPNLPEAAKTELSRLWDTEYGTNPVYARLAEEGQYSQVDLDLVTGEFTPPRHSFTGGADEFELEIGNLLAWSYPLWQGAARLAQLREAWLPYYSEDLRRERLATVGYFFDNNLNHIPPYLERELYFQAFRRFYNATGEFLQALFISRRTYPIAYDKWVREQVEEVLGLPELFPQLTGLMEIRHFASREIGEKALQLRELYQRYVLTEGVGDAAGTL